MNNVDGSQQDYGMRIYDPRIGRFLSGDPIAISFPWYTPYQLAGNTPIQAIDLDGLEPTFAMTYTYRVTALFITGSGGVGVAVDVNGNFSLYTKWSVGPALGAYAGGGIGLYLYPNATPSQLMGHGVNVGGNIGFPTISLSADIGSNRYRIR